MSDVNTRLIHALSVLTASVDRAARQMQLVATEVHHMRDELKSLQRTIQAVDTMYKNRLDAEGVAELSDATRIDQFQKYQTGVAKVVIPPIPAGPDRHA